MNSPGFRVRDATAYKGLTGLTLSRRIKASIDQDHMLSTAIICQFNSVYSMYPRILETVIVGAACMLGPKVLNGWSKVACSLL